MYEFEKYEYEFSKIYKRLLRLEMLMKHKLINSALSVYKDDVMVVFSKFFNNRHICDTYTAKKKKENYFLKIRDNKSLMPMLKFEKIINMLTLRHVLHFIFTEESFRTPMIQEQFYAAKSLNFKELKNAKNVLIELRNYIAHFNFKEYNIKKTEYLNSLILYETALGCSLGKYGLQLDNLGYKPNMSVIINKIFEFYPELFMKNTADSNFPYNKDKILVDIYEDIAILNGWEYSELKSPWDVIRKKYDINSKRAEQENLTNLETDTQISLFDWNINEENINE